MANQMDRPQRTVHTPDSHFATLPITFCKLYQNFTVSRVSSCLFIIIIKCLAYDLALVFKPQNFFFFFCWSILIYFRQRSYAHLLAMLCVLHKCANFISHFQSACLVHGNEYVHSHLWSMVQKQWKFSTHNSLMAYEWRNENVFLMVIGWVKIFIKIMTLCCMLLFFFFFFTLKLYSQFCINLRQR